MVRGNWRRGKEEKKEEEREEGGEEGGKGRRRREKEKEAWGAYAASRRVPSSAHCSFFSFLTLLSSP
jgi:hypothetical protein